MKIIICGGGKVGRALVRQLSAEGYEITLIDSRQSVLEEAVNRCDVIGVQGNGASMAVLKQAGVADADLLIAAIGPDEINLLCCMTAHKMNPKLHTIARIRNPEYNAQVYYMREDFGFSMVVNPERQSAREIERLLRYPGFLHRDSFARDRVEIVEFRVDAKSRLCGCPLYQLKKVTGEKVLVCAVLRDGVAIMPDGNFAFADGDRVFATAPTRSLALLLHNLGIITKRVRKVLICGGSKISYYLALRLIKNGIGVTIVERDYEKCLYLSENLPKANIIHEDATDINVLESEGIRQCDALVAMTGMDEMNLVIALYGNKIGVPQVITKVAHMENSPVISTLPVGSIINSNELCSNTIVRYVRAIQNQKDAAVSIHTIADGQVEAEEFLIDEAVRHCGVPLKDLPLKKNVLIVCIGKGKNLILPDGNSSFEVGDSVIIVTNRENIIGRFNDIFEESHHEF